MTVSYPDSKWDGSSENRTAGQQKSPDHRDWGRLIAEVRAIQEKLGLGDPDSGTVGTGVTDVSDSGVRRTVLTLADVEVSCAEGSTKEYGSSLLYTFPAGAIKVLGITVDLTLTSTDYAAVEEGDLALGEVAATDQALTGTDVTWLAASALTFGSGTATVQDQDDTVAVQDGTTTAEKVYLNIAMDNGGGAGDIVVNGTVTIHWCNLGDY